MVSHRRTLGDGRVLVFSGRLESGGRIRSPIRRQDHRRHRQLGRGASPPDFTPTMTGADFNCRSIQACTWRRTAASITRTRTGGSRSSNRRRARWTITGPTSGTWTISAFARRTAAARRGDECALPPAQDGKILVVGGSEARNAPACRCSGAAVEAGMRIHVADPADRGARNILNTQAGGPPNVDACAGERHNNRPASTATCAAARCHRARLRRARPL